MNHILDKRQDLFLFFVFPFIELFYFLFLLQEIAAVFTFPLPVILFLSLVLSFCLLFLFYLIRKQYRKKQLSQAYEELSKLRDTQAAYRLTAEQHRKELETLRESFADQLSAICAALQESRFQEAGHLTTQLSRQIAATKEYPFCPNAVINAVLTDKEALCRKLSVHFHADLTIGACASVNKVHLCSIFTNLLDNAIQACMELPADASRFIQVAALQNGDYIHIKVSNSAPAKTAAQAAFPAAGRPAKEHGYGQKILADIAKQYSGEWNTAYRDNVYEATISLLLPPEDEG